MKQIPNKSRVFFYAKRIQNFLQFSAVTEAGTTGSTIK